MMNDMMPTIEETIDMNDIAQHEHEQWLRECEREERWAALEAAHEAKHGMPLLTSTEWSSTPSTKTLGSTKVFASNTGGPARWPWRSRPYYIAMIKLGMEVMNLDGYLE